MEPTLPACPNCRSLSVRLFGHQSGKQRFRCRDCHKTWRDGPNSRTADPQRKAMILAAYHERVSMRGLARTFGVGRNTVTKWLKKSQPVAAADAAAEPDAGSSPA